MEDLRVPSLVSSIGAGLNDGCSASSLDLGDKSRGWEDTGALGLGAGDSTVTEWGGGGQDWDNGCGTKDDNWAGAGRSDLVDTSGIADSARGAGARASASSSSGLRLYMLDIVKIVF